MPRQKRTPQTPSNSEYSSQSLRVRHGDRTGGSTNINLITEDTTKGQRSNYSWKRLYRRHRGTAMKVSAVLLLALVGVSLWGSGESQINLPGRQRGREQQSWKQGKVGHINRQKKLSRNDIKYFSHNLSSPADFRKHLDQILIPRVPGTQGSLKVRNYIRNTMSDLGWTVEVDSHTGKTPLGDKPFHNVIATLDPSAPRRLVLVCHYDSKMDPPGFLGMTDSAVPCAQMLNLAKVMNMHLRENTFNGNPVTLQLLFLDGEEAFVSWSRTDSTYGARNLAKKWARTDFRHNGESGKELDRIDMFVLLDLIGTTDTQFMNLQKDTAGPYDRLAALESDLRGVERALPRQCLARGQSYPGKTVFNTRKAFSAGRSIEDDHIPFLERGVPILHLISVPFPSVWHKESDNGDAVDYGRTEFISAVLRLFVAEYLGMASDNRANENDPCRL